MAEPDHWLIVVGCFAFGIVGVGLLAWLTRDR